MTPPSADPKTEFLVACLCAQWCGTCREYRAGFMALEAAFPGATFRWVDVEDEADALGDVDVENFPTVLIQRGEAVLFFGTMLPDHGLLRRVVETLTAQTAEESAAYSVATAERRGWQGVYNLRGALRE